MFHKMFLNVQRVCSNVVLICISQAINLSIVAQIFYF